MRAHSRKFLERGPAVSCDESHSVIHVWSGNTYHRGTIGNRGHPLLAYRENVIPNGEWRNAQVVAEEELSPVPGSIIELCARLSTAHRLQ